MPAKTRTSDPVQRGHGPPSGQKAREEGFVRFLIAPANAELPGACFCRVERPH